MEAKLRGGEDYHTLWDRDAYLSNWHSETCEGWPYMSKVMESLHEIYSEGQVTGKRIIDIGCGPTVYSLIPAAKWFEELYLADFCQSNVDAVQKWLDKDPGSFDWKTHFQLFAKMDGNRDAWKQYEDLVRAKAKGALQCDFFKSNPLHPKDLGKFDAVNTTLALISGAKTVDQYRAALQNIVNILKPGGFLTEVVSLECTFYCVGNEKFSCVSITKDEVMKAFKDAGLEVLKCLEKSTQMDSDASLTLGSLTVLGKKI